jgi:hypothetical protein
LGTANAFSADSVRRSLDIASETSLFGRPVVMAWGTTMGLLHPRHFVLRPAQSSGADTAIPQDGQLKRIMVMLWVEEEKSYQK